MNCRYKVYEINLSLSNISGGINFLMGYINLVQSSNEYEVHKDN